MTGAQPQLKQNKHADGQAGRGVPSQTTVAPWQVRVKYALDRFIALLLLMTFAPFLIVIAAAIKLGDGGPVFFLQQRIGLHGKIYNILKFRTMLVNADRFLDANGMPTKARVTAVGKFLRRTSLDELPQLINILRGEMSLVGPRPVLPSHEKAYAGPYADRLAMKPGISGLAQVNGRNTLPWSRRLSYDLEYVHNYSLWLDLKILFKTVAVALLMQGISDDRNKSVVDDL